MSDEDAGDLSSLTEAIEANARSWNSYWSWKDKPVGERGAAYTILKAAGIHAEDLVSREEGQDPPDCEATVDDCLTGIEVTELVHRPTLERSLKAQKHRALGKEPKQGEAYFVWERADLLVALQDRIDAKDRGKLKGGPYRRYILVIHTDEMFLEATKLEQWLTGATFRARRITDVVLGLSYDPAQKCCPVFKLRVCCYDQRV
jgi:hypothetical protein